MTSNLKRLLRTVKRSDLLVSSAVEKWLREHPEGLVLNGNEVRWLRILATTMPRDRSGESSASARGTCMRRQIFTSIGMEGSRGLDIVLQNLFNDATWRHIRWQLMLLQAGVLHNVEVPVKRPGWVVGTMDGEGDGFGFEFKSIWSLTAVAEGPKPEHLLQIHSYLFARPDLKVFSLVYEDKRTNDWREFIIKRDPKLIAEVRIELRELRAARKAKILPDILEECANGKGPTYRKCPYRIECLDIETWKEAKALAP